MKLNRLAYAVLIITPISQAFLWIAYASKVMNIAALITAVAFFILFFILSIKFIDKYKKLKLQISRDSLTQLYNRLHLDETLEKEIERAKRNKKSLGIILFDIDDFKNINDNYGHYIGDQILIKLSKIISAVVRPYDTLGRWGGEEFEIISPDVSRDTLIEIAERIRLAAEEAHLNRKFPVTISVGCTLMNESDDAQSLYMRVDDAMFDAKDQGKNRVVFY